MHEPAKPQFRITPWQTVILVCRKCGKKLNGGFGPKRRDDLRSELRKALRAAGHRRDVRVIQTGCFGVCPKNGVTALNATSPGKLYVIPAGTQPETAVEVLLGGLHPADEGIVETA